MRLYRHPFLLSFFFLLGLFGVVWCATVIERFLLPTPTARFGVTFSAPYTEYLGNNPRAVFTALLDDLRIRHFRLTIPWDAVEKSRGQFTFADIEWQLDEAEKRDANAIVAIGRRTPRWPECHDPLWLDKMTRDEQEAATLTLLKKEVETLRHRTNIIAWQVENEPSLRVFGACKPQRKAFLKEEIDLVRSLDSTRPVFTTESGELTTGLWSVPFVDSIGLSLYRQTWNSVIGKVIYPLPPAFYTRRADFLRHLFGTHVFLSELQAEPWAASALTSAPIPEQLTLMNAQTLHNAAAFATATRLSPIYLWGAEWWYWIKQKGHPEIWEAAREIFQAE
jgi:hypothetical protein